jgi:hypothetical protein
MRKENDEMNILNEQESVSSETISHHQDDTQAGIKLNSDHETDDLNHDKDEPPDSPEFDLSLPSKNKKKRRAKVKVSDAAPDEASGGKQTKLVTVVNPTESLEPGKSSR